MTIQEKIEEYNKKPFEIGDKIIWSKVIEEEVSVASRNKKSKKVSYSKEKVNKLFVSEGKIIQVLSDNEQLIIELPDYKKIPTIIKTNNNVVTVPISEITYSHRHIGENPFVEQDWNSRINFYQTDIEQILWRIGYDRRESKYKHEKIGDIIIPELDWNPTIINSQGEEIVYQRPFVWSLQEKQLLIDSIYNNIEIGKVVVRLRSWNWVENRLKQNKIEHTAFKQIVDGKQRCNTILEFIKNKFPDSYGNYWDDLSDIAKRKFFSFRYITYGELGENSTDEDVLNTFLCINHTGTPMSPEHIEFIKSLKVK